MKTVKLVCRPCFVCGKQAIVEIPATDEQLDEYELGYKNIQTVFPDLAPEIREMMISGTHPACFEKMFEDE